jgi:hypothetical protein
LSEALHLGCGRGRIDEAGSFDYRFESGHERPVGAIPRLPTRRNGWQYVIPEALLTCRSQASNASESTSAIGLG